MREAQTSGRWRRVDLAVITLAVVFAAGYFFRAMGDGDSARFPVAEVIRVEAGGVAGKKISPGFEKTALVHLRILEGPLEGRQCSSHVITEGGARHAMALRAGDRVTLQVDGAGSGLCVGIDDYHRLPALLFVMALVGAAVVGITGRQGLLALLALALTLILVFGILSGMLLAGHPPVLLAVAVSVAVTSVTLLIVGGCTRKTFVACAGTLGGVACAAALGAVVTPLLSLSGLAGQEAVFLQALSLKLDPRGLLLCGVIIGALGAVMDVCMSIASAQEELQTTGAGLSTRQMFGSGLKIGRDLIGTMTNTLVLAYTGTSLTFILLVTAQRTTFPLSRLLNLEIVTVEILRALVGLFGMVTAIPMASLAGAIAFGDVGRQRRTV